MERYAQPRQKFRALLPISRRKRLSAMQAHHVAKAASLQQIIEAATLERALCIAKHDRIFIERLKLEVRKHLELAGVQFNERKQ